MWQGESSKVKGKKRIPGVGGWSSSSMARDRSVKETGTFETFVQCIGLFCGLENHHVTRCGEYNLKKS